MSIEKAGSKEYISTMDNGDSSDTAAIEQLINDNLFNDVLANAFVRARGRCEYCGADLLMSRQGYAIAETDHLLSSSDFPKLYNDKQNHVLSCRPCNGTKKDWSPLNKGETAEQMLEKRRGVLILRATKYIADEMAKYDEDWRKVTKILHGIWWKGSSE